MRKVDSQSAVVPLAPSTSTDLTTRSVVPEAGGRAAQGAPFAGLGKRTVSVRGAESGLAAAAAAPRAALPKAGVAGSPEETGDHPGKRPLGAPRAKSGVDAEHKEDPSKPDTGEHAGAASQNLEEPQTDHALHHAGHAAHAAHHAQIAAAKARHDQQKQVSDHYKRVAELRSANLAKLVGN